MINYDIRSIPPKETYIWLLKKHYAHRLPPISYAFGLYDENKILQGVCTFGDCGGNTSLHTLIDGYPILELNRLCVNEGLPKNTLSFFISKCFKILPKPLVLISYADSTMYHHGYVYQATNWIYTGTTGCREEWIRKSDGKIFHAKTIYDKYGSSKKENAKKYGYLLKKTKPKHRYFKFTGNKTEKKEMLYKLKLKYKILSYPKGNNKRYDASYNPKVQRVLF